MSARKSDKATKAVVSLLEDDQEWDGPEALAIAIINKLDEVRADKTSYVAVMQFGMGDQVFYVGIGPYAGRKSAANAVAGHPAFGEAAKTAVIPMRTPENLAKMLEDIDKQPALSGDWAVVREDATLFKRGWNGKRDTRRKYEKRAS